MRGRFMSAAAGLVLTLSVVAQTPADKPAQPEVGKPAPAFELPGLDEKTYQLSDFKGKIVVLHFQSKDCPWERKYQPVLNQLATKFGPTEKDGKKVEKVVFLGINSNASEKVADIKQTAEQEKVPYMILKDEGNKVADAYAATTTPHIFVIDEKGVLRYKGGVEKAPLSPDEAGKSKEQYLAPALQSLLEGKELSVKESKSIGCSIKRGRKAS